MKWITIIKRERIIWHEHFIPSLIAAIAVAAIAYVFEATTSNIVLFASVGASAVILTHRKSHHLTKLHTTIVAYLIAIGVSLFTFIINKWFPIHIAINIFIVVFLVSMLLFLFNVFHPPAITASLSFLLLDRPTIDLVYLFVAIIALLILVRFATYVICRHLPVKEFMAEFEKSF